MCRRITQLCALLVMSLLPVALDAQTGTMRASVPSPTAASLGRFGDVPVSLHTGIPTIGVPLYTAKGRTLEVPIGLNFHAGGVRVEEIGGWVGLGWALQAGGTITRTVRGIPDEHTNGYINTGSVFYEWGQHTNPSGTLLDNIAAGTVDGDPDQFFFNVAGLSGQFIIGPVDSLGTIEVRTAPYQDIRIEPSAGFDTLTVTSGDGTRYTFAAKETHSDISTSTSTGGSNPVPSSVGDTHVSTWHLTQIQAPGGDDVDFFYSTFSATHEIGTYEEDFKNRVGGVGGQCVPMGIDNSTKYTVTGQRLDSIKAAAHTVRFHSSLRTDALHPNTSAQQEYRLDSLSVETPGGSLLKTFLLSYNYTGGRLRLTEVQEKGFNGNLLPPYEFAYSSTSLPSLTSNAQDHWGFYNGATSNSSLIPTAPNPLGGIFSGADRDPDVDYMDAGALTKITYPTGGYTEFTWEGNDYGGIGSGATIPKVLGDLQTKIVTGGAYQGIKTGTFTIGGSEDVIVTVTVTMDPNPCPECLAEIQSEYTASGPGTYYVTLSPGTYTLRAWDGSLGGFSKIKVQWREETPISDISGMPGKAAGGLRIARIVTSDGLDSIGGATEMVREFRYVLQSDTTLSSGLVSHEPTYTHEFSISGCAYYSISSASRLPLGDGAPVSYREVTVLHGDNGEFGQTRHAFRSVVNASDGSNSSPWPFATDTRRAWKRGQETLIEEYNAAGDIQRKSAHQFAFLITDSIASHKYRGISVKAVNVGGGVSGWMFGDFEVESGWTYPMADTVVFYNPSGGSPVTTIKTYTYGNSLHGQPTEIVEVDSEGDEWITRMRYPDDYASGGTGTAAQAITAMQSDGSAFMPATVIEQWIAEDDGTEKVHRGNLTTFKDWGSGKVLPHETFVLDSDGALSSFTASSVSGSFTKDSNYVLNESVYSYDSWGRPAELDDARGERTNFDYGGNSNDAFLIEVDQEDGGSSSLVSTITYTSRGEVASVTDPGGATRTFEYDDHQRLTTTKNDGSTVVQRVSYSPGRSTSGGALTTANSVTTINYLQQSPSVDSVESREYLDGLGRTIQSVSQLDSATWSVSSGTEYDEQGRSWRVWNPFALGSPAFDPAWSDSATAHWNAYLGVSNAKPYSETIYAADQLARPEVTFKPYTGTAPADSVLHEYYTNQTSDFDCSKATDEEGHVTESCKNVFGHLAWEKANTAETDYFPNKFGEVLQTEDPRSLDSDYLYSTRGLLYQKETPDAGITKFAYDLGGNLRFVQDANQAVAGTVTFTTYDFANRPLEAGEGTATWGSLNPDGTNVLDTTDTNWDQVWAYDAKPGTVTAPWSLFSSEIAGVSLSNVSGRLAAVASKSGGSWQLSLFSYDDDGQVSAQHTFTHANGGTSVASPLNTTVEYTRNLQGAVVEKNVTVGAETFNQWFEYNEGGRLWKVFASTSSTKPGTPDVTYAYTVDGQLASREFKGDASVPLSYTVRNELEAIGDPMTTTYPFSISYEYNDDGTVDRQTFYNAAGKQWHNRNRYDFTYDGQKRMTQSLYWNWNWSTNSWSSSYSETERGISYDLSGNIQQYWRYRHSSVLVDNPTYTYATDSNRLLSITDAVSTTSETWDLETGTFSYDSVGNMLTAPEPYSMTAATYDRRNLPISQTASSVTSTYRYDGAGQRIAKQVGSGDVEYYILEGALTLGVFTLDSSDSVTAWHFNIEAGGTVVGRETDAGDRYFYHTDMLGSTRTVVDDSGTAVEGYFYYPFGMLNENLSPNSGATKEGFTGKEVDGESGLQYFGARYYMPAVTRWGQVDPMADKFAAWSPYNYVLANPAGLTDPDGRCPEFLTGLPCGEANLVKAAVGAINVARGMAGVIAGSQLATTAAVSSVAFGPVTAPVSAVATAKVAGGLANINRGLQQMREGLVEGGDPSARNLLGLAPFGQKFDDPAEQQPQDYIRVTAKELGSNPVEALKKITADFFAIDLNDGGN